jgi:hypothetical protein
VTRIDVHTGELARGGKRLQGLERETESRVATVNGLVGQLDMRIRGRERIAERLVAIRRTLDRQADFLTRQASFLESAVHRYEAADERAVRDLPQDPRKKAGWFAGLLRRAQEQWVRAWQAFVSGARKFNPAAIVAQFQRFRSEFLSTARRHPELWLLLFLSSGHPVISSTIATAYWAARYREMAPMYAADDATGERLRAVLAKPEYSSERWAAADYDGRREMMEDLSKEVAEAMGVPNVPVSWQPPEGEEPFSPNTRGAYYDKQGVIALNPALLGQAEPPSDTLIHEYRHAYQDEASDRDYDRELVVPDVKRKEWGDNFDDYKDQKTYGWKAYRDQSIERDARGMAGLAT